MPYQQRKQLIQSIENQRNGRTLICLFNFDRPSEPTLPGMSLQFNADMKEVLFRVLKDSRKKAGIDLCLYTRGGDINSVWPLVSLIREFDRHYQVLVPYRCLSSGTLVALGAQHILMGPLSELSPIDPSTSNPFNPVDPANNNSRMAINVGDVRAYRSFLSEQNREAELEGIEDIAPEDLTSYIDKLTERVHPLALGNVQRALYQIRQLAENLLGFHGVKGENIAAMSEALITRFYTHLHKINRHEARDMLGARVEFMPARLSTAVDNLLRAYEDDFELRRTCYAQPLLQGKAEAELSYVGGVVEGQVRSYVHQSRVIVRPRVIATATAAGAAKPAAPVTRGVEVEIQEQGWQHNRSGV